MTKQSKKKKSSPIKSNAEEVERRKRLLSIIGIGHDTATDVAERHDDYYAEVIWEHLKRARRKDLDKKA